MSGGSGGSGNSSNSSGNSGSGHHASGGSKQSGGSRASHGSGNNAPDVAYVDASTNNTRYGATDDDAERQKKTGTAAGNPQGFMAHKGASGEGGDAEDTKHHVPFGRGKR